MIFEHTLGTVFVWRLHCRTSTCSNITGFLSYQLAPARCCLSKHWDQSFWRWNWANRSDATRWIIIRYTFWKKWLTWQYWTNLSSTLDNSCLTQINKIISHPTLPLLITGHENKLIKFYDTNSGMCEAVGRFSDALKSNTHISFYRRLCIYNASAPGWSHCTRYRSQRLYLNIRRTWWIYTSVGHIHYIKIVCTGVHGTP